VQKRHSVADETSSEDQQSGIRRARVSFHEHGTDTVTEPWRVRQLLAGMEGVQVLLLEEDRDDAELLRIAFEAAGAEVRVSSSARDAFESLQASKADVIVASASMGDDADELCRAIRAKSGSDNPVVIALGASGKPEARVNAQVVGFDAYLVKPVAPHRVVAAVRDLLDG
jgi:DNA-binding response OmpR family regulator